MSISVSVSEAFNISSNDCFCFQPTFYFLICLLCICINTFCLNEFSCPHLSVDAHFSVDLVENSAKNTVKSTSLARAINNKHTSKCCPSLFSTHWRLPFHSKTYWEAKERSREDPALTNAFLGSHSVFHGQIKLQERPSGLKTCFPCAMNFHLEAIDMKDLENLWLPLKHSLKGPMAQDKATRPKKHDKDSGYCP